MDKPKQNEATFWEKTTRYAALKQNSVYDPAKGKAKGKGKPDKGKGKAKSKGKPDKGKGKAKSKGKSQGGGANNPPEHDRRQQEAPADWAWTGEERARTNQRSLEWNVWGNQGWNNQNWHF